MYLEVTAGLGEEQWYFYFKWDNSAWQLLGMYPQRQEPNQLTPKPERVPDIESFLRLKGLELVEKRLV